MGVTLSLKVRLATKESGLYEKRTMEEVATILTKLLQDLGKMVVPGVNLSDLEMYAVRFLSEQKANSANFLYFPSWAKKPYPNVLCLSLNSVAAHGALYPYVLQEGDILTIDCGIEKNGFYADAALSTGCGIISSRDARLLRYAKNTLFVGLRQLKAGVKITEPGRAMDIYARRSGFRIMKSLAGHAIGKKMHESPSIPMFALPLEEQRYVDDKNRVYYSYKEYDDIPVFQAGQIVCLEPHLTYKDEFGRVSADGWSVHTRDGKNVAMFEVMAQITEDGYKLLTPHIQ